MTRILIVEDEPSLAEPLAFLLEREGYEPTIAADGLAAVAYRVRFGVAVLSGDPVGAPESQPLAVAAYREDGGSVGIESVGHASCPGWVTSREGARPSCVRGDD